MKLYSFAQSSTAYRVRIALNLKGVSYDTVEVDLTNGDHKSPEYGQVNPSLAVPTLVTDAGDVLTQSMAILTYLDAVEPEPKLVPADPLERAKVEAAAQVIAMDIHPVNNLGLRQRLAEMGHAPQDITDWMNHWMLKGLTAFQDLVPPVGNFAFGETPTLADICLIPQMFNAHRWGLDLSTLTRLTDIEARCLALPAFEAARPENQKETA